MSAEAGAIGEAIEARRGSPRRVLRLGALATHPIQYHAPLHRALAATPDVDLTVYFAHRPSPAEQGLGFGVPFSWDEDLVTGYRHVWLRNLADEVRRRNGRPFRDGFRDYDTPEIADVINREPFDAFLLHGWRVRSDWQALHACRSRGVPVLVRGDSQLWGEHVPKRWVKRLLYRRLLGQFAVCLSVGARNDAYLRYYGAKRVVRSPHFIDNALFARRAADALGARDTHRAGWGVRPGALVLAFVGKLGRHKRPLDLVQAVHGLAGVHVLFVGDGPLRGDCSRLASRLGVAATFTGFMNQSAIPQAYTAADVLVLPSGSGRETWGLVVNEAMACGRPAIVSDAAGCTPDLIREGETGYSYPARDVAQLRARIARFLDTPGTAARLGVAAVRHVAQFTPEMAAAGVLRAAETAGMGAGSV